MASERKLTVTISGDAKGLNRALGDVRSFGSKFGGGMARAGKAGALAFGGALTVGVGAALVNLKTGFDSLVRIERINAQTAAAIKSTGGASGVSAKQVEGLAGQLEALTGIEAESIQEGQNLLLTFTNVANRAGKGNDIFDQSTKVLVDMATAMGGDAKGSAIQLGKALNDPTKGITALTRVGVTFTDEQKAQIKQMQKMGDVTGAQKIILAELNKEFGGSAKAFGATTQGRMAKLGHKFGEVQERIAEGLLPVAEQLIAWGTDLMPKMAAKLGPVFDQVTATMRSAVDWFRANWPEIQRVAQDVLGRVQAVIGAVVGFVRAHWPEVQRIIGSVLTTVRTIVQGFVSLVTTLWENFGNNILSFVQRIWPNIKQVIDAALRIIRGIVQTVTSLIKGDWGKVWDGIKQVVSGAWSGILAIIKGALEAVRLVIGAALEVLGAILKGAWSKIVDGATAAWDGLIDFIGKLPGRVATAASGMFDGIKDAARSVINWLIDAWNKLDFGISISIPDWVPGVGGKGFEVDDIIPDIPRLAKGGTATRAGTALVGDAGPELVDLPRGASVVPLSRRAAAGPAGGAGTTVVLQLAPPPGADQRWLDWLADAIARDARQRGRLSTAIRKAAG